MHTLICSAYSSIKKSNIVEAKQQLKHIMDELDEYYA